MIIVVNHSDEEVNIELADLIRAAILNTASYNAGDYGEVSIVVCQTAIAPRVPMDSQRIHRFSP